MRELKTSHVECGYCDARLDDTTEAFAEHDAKCEQNPLVKRIAELESALRNTLESNGELRAWRTAHNEWAETAQRLIEHLQSQLAWTPVSDGLPTEPGVYEFTDGTPDDTKLYTYQHSRWYGHKVTSGETPLAKATWAYTHYRRIELPKGET